VAKGPASIRGASIRKNVLRFQGNGSSPERGDPRFLTDEAPFQMSVACFPPNDPVFEMNRARLQMNDALSSSNDSLPGRNGASSQPNLASREVSVSRATRNAASVRRIVPPET